MSSKSRIENDAKGQFAPSQADRRSDGVASATPRNVTGEEDATVENASEKTRPKARFNERSQTNNRG